MPVDRSLRTQLKRGLLKRCPRCGEGRVFASYFHMRQRCPVCNYGFEREEGYWTGAMIVNIAACEVWFFVLFVGVLLATMPGVNWIAILLVALVTNGLLPVFFYPHSKTIWMAFDIYLHPLAAGEG